MTDMELFAAVIVSVIVLGLSAWTISMAWRGRRRPGIEDAAQLAEALKSERRKA